MKYYHGTSATSGESIITNGFTSGKLWIPSEDDMVYMIAETYDNDDASYSDFEYLPAVRFAAEAGQIAAAVSNQLDRNIIIFEFDIPNDIELEVDNTNGATNGSYCIDYEELNELIKNGSIQVNIYRLHDAYEPYLRVFYLQGTSPEFLLLEPQLEKIRQSLNKVDTCWFFDDYCGVWSNYDKSQLSWA